MRIAMIVNPAAGRRRALQAAFRAERVLVQGGWQVERLHTSTHGEARTLATQAAASGFDAVFACGGDGTLSQVVEGLLDTGVPAGLIPTGTGNDFARTIALSHDPTIAAWQALCGRASAVDLLNVNEGALWVLNILGVGFDAAVTARINRRRRLIAGRIAYLTAVFQELIHYRPIEVFVGMETESWSGKAMLVAVANAQCYGAGMRIAPHADIVDGLLDVIVVEDVSRLAFLRAFPSVFRGSHDQHPAVRMWQAQEVYIETKSNAFFLADGDLHGRTPIRVRVAPKRAWLWMPGAALRS
ncbi:MAG: diacylglycerol/lipid kinase family protein [Candidatus Zipacnadales bacterium]